MPFYDYYDDDYLSTRMENCHLDEALYNEHRRRLEQARRFKRVLKNAKTREREAGKREGKEEGKAEGREEVMGMQRVWDGGVEWARKNDGRGGSQVQKAISAAPPASSHHKSRALLEAPSKAPSVTPSARENIEKFVREQQSRSSVASSARPSAHLSAQQHRSASHAPSRAPSRPMGLAVSLSIS